MSRSMRKIGAAIPYTGKVGKRGRPKIPEKDRLTVGYFVRFKKSEAKKLEKLGKPVEVIRRAALRDIGVKQ